MDKVPSVYSLDMHERLKAAQAALLVEEELIRELSTNNRDWSHAFNIEAAAKRNKTARMALGICQERRMALLGIIDRLTREQKAHNA